MGAALKPSESEPDLVALQRTLYDSRNPTRRWLHRDRLERVGAELRAAAAAGPAGRALEIGPGGGPYVGLLCDLYREVVASDVEGSYLEHVRAAHGERSNLTLVEDDAAASLLEPGSFDLVLCSEVIEHTRDPAAVIRGIATLLRPGGIAVISTPQAHSTAEIVGKVAFAPGPIHLARLIYREPVLPPGHISLLTRARMRELLAEAGLRVRSHAVACLYLPVIAEFGGERGARLQQRLSRRLAGGRLAGLLWTQHWTVERPA